MKTLTTTLLISLALVGAGAQAADLSQAKSSAQVATELQQAKASGQYTFGELDYPPALPQAASLSSQQVSDELQQAKINGQYTFGELQYPPVTAAPATKAAKSRADAGRTGAGQGQRPVHLRRAGIPADRALNRPSGELLAVAGRPRTASWSGAGFSATTSGCSTAAAEMPRFLPIEIGRQGRAPAGASCPKGRVILRRPCDEKSRRA